MSQKPAVAIALAGMVALAVPALGSAVSPIPGEVAAITSASTPVWNDLPIWAKRTRYQPGAIVRYGTRAYEALRSGKNRKPKSVSVYWAIVYAIGQPGTGPVGPTGTTGPTGPSGTTGPTGPTGPSNGHVATNAAPVVLAPGWLPLVSLTLGPGHYVLSATTNLESAGAGVLECNFTNATGAPVTPAPLWTRGVFAGANAHSNVAITYALSLPVIAGNATESVALACRASVPAAVTRGTAALTAIKVGSLS